jgi:hypothetical protein
VDRGEYRQAAGVGAKREGELIVAIWR